MPDTPLEERLAAVERALGDEEVDAHAPDGEPLSARVAALEEDVAELEAAVQAVRGYVGGVRHVNEEVERRADAALATAEAVERTLAAEDGREHRQAPPAPSSTEEARPDPASRDHVESPTDGERPASDAITRPCPHCGNDAGTARNGHRGSDLDEDRPADPRESERMDQPPGARRGPRPVGQRHVGEDDAKEATGLLDRVREVL